jgi:heparosan-N-sulfate-glucuronate 5-epimerase
LCLTEKGGQAPLAAKHPMKLFVRQSLDVDRLPVGRHVSAEAVRGYYIDFREKTTRPTWPPEWFPWPGFHRFMGISQWGLGCYERYLSGEGEEWLAAALAAGEFMAEVQESNGGWPEPKAPHTFKLQAPWLSAMAQGQCSSLLTRLSLETGSEELAASAVRGLAPLRIGTERGGVAATLDGGPFLEEYPTEPPSFVLNGAIFAGWGAHDVGAGLADDEARSLFEAVVETLARTIGRWDTGYWSLYDLFPHRVRNVASPFYHALHARQLDALADMSGRPELAAAAERFRTYARRRRNRARALGAKVTFRLLVPHRKRGAVRA